MGTRSLTYISDSKDSEPFVCIYRQFDGYPTGLGDDIATFVGPRRLVNGFNPKESTGVFNGMGDLAAMLIWHLKSGNVGNVYIISNKLGTDAGQDYEYYLYPDKGDTYIRCHECYGEEGRVIYDGPASEFDGEGIETALAED